MGITPADLGFSGTVGEAWSEIALRFTLSMPGLTTAIVGTTRPSNIKCNLEIAAKGILPEKIVVELRSAFRSAENDAADPWLAQT